MYEDGAGVVHNIRSVEVYLPWSDTWFNLPTLPTFTDDGVQYNITNAQIFNILLKNGGYKLFLVGGMDYDIEGEALMTTKHIYHLHYNGSYHWNHNSDLFSDMGK